MKIILGASSKFGRLVVVLAAVLLASLALGLSGVAFALPPVDGGGGDPGDIEYDPPSGGFEWRMDSRFGRDDDHDGVTDYHWDQATATYDQSYINPTSFNVSFNGCPTEEEMGSADTPGSELYTWNFGDGTTRQVRNCFPEHRYSEQREYDVTLSYNDPTTGENVSFSQKVKIRDILIVSLGDSYGSGEGSPDVPIPTWEGWGLYEASTVLHPLLHPLRYGNWPTGEAKWVDKRCHRSAYAGSAQAARDLEYSDPHTSVTFVSFACSGATINRPTTTDNDPNKPQGSGVLGSYRGIDPPNAGDPSSHNSANFLPPQVDALARTLAGCAPTDSNCVNRQGRRIDSLIVSGGGNDAYFADVVTKCLMEGACNTHEETINMKSQGLAELPERYDDLAFAIHAQNPFGRPALNVSKVYVTEYPDPTRDDNGNTCNGMLENEIIWGLSINRVESDWVRSQFHGPLNQTMAAAATEHGWEYVDGISSQFANHGYCAKDHWIVHPMESRRNQGPYRVRPFESWEHTDVLGKQTGMMHPNFMGFRAYSNALVPRLQAQFNQNPNDPLPTFTTTLQAYNATSQRSADGWFTGATGANSTQLDMAVLTVAVEDPSGVSSGIGTSFGGICSGTGPIDCMVENISPQRKEWRFRIREDGIHKLEFAARGNDGQTNTFSHEVRVDLHDPEAAALPDRPPDENGRYTAPVDVWMNGTDFTGGSGIEKFQYTIGGGPVQEIEPGGTVTLQPEETRLRYWSVDFAGRKSAVRDFIPRDRIAFLSARENNIEQVWATDTDGAFSTRITNSTAAEGDRAPAFSPDGKKIAFASLRAGIDDYEIYVANADGTNPVRLTDNLHEDRSTTFSPDGKKIAFARFENNNWDIWVMNADGTAQTRLTSHVATDNVPAFSPDGSKITFESNRDGNNEIYVMNADGTAQTRLTSHAADDRSPAFSPDGKKIAFASTRDVAGQHEIYVMNANGTNPMRLTNSSGIDISPAYSPDGRKLAFASFRDGNYEVYVANADGSNQTNVTRNPADDTQPDWGLVYNDAFASSRAVTGASTSIAGSSLAATRENGEPDHYIPVNDVDWIGDNSVWYRWTAPASGPVELDLCETNFDTILTVYTGGSLGTLQRVANNNNACPSGWGSKLSFEATAGTVYNIAISGAGGLRAGIFTLKLNLAADNTPPPAPVITSPTNAPLLRDGAVTVSGTAEPNSTVRLREGEEFRGGSQAGSNGSWTAQLTGISDGAHTYVAEALDGAGNTSAASNPVTITMDSTPPQTTITSGPSGSTNSTTASFAFSSETGASFECRLTRNGDDPSTFASCQSSKTYTNLERTGYVFEVRAVDTAGNPDPTPASRGWTVNPLCTKTGTSANNVISGTSGDDVICGGGGNDTIKGLGGNDILRGEAGNDKLIGGVGDDTLDGGLGTDTVSYSTSLTAVTASLASNTASGEGSDTFIAAENLLGSSKADILTGSGTKNTLTGGGGNDLERGGAGNDKVIGSGGADELSGEDGSDTVNSKDGVDGNDRLDGGPGTDTKVTDASEASVVGFP